QPVVDIEAATERSPQGASVGVGALFGDITLVVQGVRNVVAIAVGDPLQAAGLVVGEGEGVAVRRGEGFHFATGQVGPAGGAAGAAGGLGDGCQAIRARFPLVAEVQAVGAVLRNQLPEGVIAEIVPQHYALRMGHPQQHALVLVEVGVIRVVLEVGDVGDIGTGPINGTQLAIGAVVFKAGGAGNRGAGGGVARLGATEQVAEVIVFLRGDLAFTGIDGFFGNTGDFAL